MESTSEWSPNRRTVRIGALRITDQEYCAIDEELRTRPVPEEIRHLRLHERVPYKEEITLVCELHRSDHSKSQFKVRCRDVSRGGLCFLHGAFIYPGTSCRITLITPERKGYRVSAQIIRCEYIRGYIHDIGVQFDELIDVNLIAPSTAA